MKSYCTHFFKQIYSQLAIHWTVDMLLALGLIIAAPLLCSQCEDLDPKILQVARILQTMFEERDLKVQQYFETIAQLQHALNCLQKNSTETEKALERMEIEVQSLKEKNEELERNATSAGRRISALETAVDKCAKLTSNGRISRDILPGSYANYTLEDVQWQSVHMAAAAACRGVSVSKGPHANRVIPNRDGVACSVVCAETTYTHCDGTVNLMGFKGQSVQNNSPVGVFYNYGCEHQQYRGQSEQGYSNGRILTTNYYIGYCCCRH